MGRPFGVLTKTQYNIQGQGWVKDFVNNVNEFLVGHAEVETRHPWDEGILRFKNLINEFSKYT